MKRNIFNKGIVDELLQGVIFSGAIADGYEDCDVFGLIITPRCDIAQDKVRTIHYLPIVSYDDWHNKELLVWYQQEEIEKSKRVLECQFQSSGIPLHLLDANYRLSPSDLKDFLRDKKVSNDLIDKIQRHWSLQDIDNCKTMVKSWKNYDNRINELVRGGMERNLLLENWDRKDNYYVIKLTEIRHLDINTARKLIGGMLVRDIDFSKDELKECNENLKRYQVVASLKSPYIEYVTQRISNAFFRIGIEDWDDRKKLVSKLKVK